MHVLIIGGTGFIGPWVVRRLADEGHRITLFHRGQTMVDLPPAVSHIHGERQNLSAFAAALARLAPDVVLDMFPYAEQEARVVMHL